MGIITPAGLAKALGVQKQYIYEHMKNGTMPIGTIKKVKLYNTYFIYPQKVKDIFGEDVYNLAIKYSA